jgi:hypothetical protein
MLELHKSEIRDQKIDDIFDDLDWWDNRYGHTR